MKVMIATDGTEDAIQAAQVALNYLPEGCEFVLVTVIQDYENPLETAGGLEGPWLDAEESEWEYQIHLSKAQSALAKTQEALGKPAETRLIPTDANPGHALVEVANQMKPDLLVLGSGDKGMLWRWLTGSVSDYVFHHSPCPVLVVPKRGHATA